MPFPSKTDRGSILAAALQEVVGGGIRNLSLRRIAATLGLTPNALYRYFSDRAELEEAVAEECARRLEGTLRKAADGLAGTEAISEMAGAYLRFARDNRNLYEVFMGFQTPDRDGSSRQNLWSFTVEQVQSITGEANARQAAVALWELLHGAATLEAGQVFGENKPASGFDFGLKAWLLLAGTPVPASRAKKSADSSAR